MSAADPAISVIVPLWQPWEATDRLWKSLEHQFVPFELITVDGSCGAPAARNRGAGLATGVFLFFCDQDVELYPSCLSSLHAALLAEPSAGYAYCDYARSGALTGIHRARPFSPHALYQKNFISTMSLLRRPLFPGFDVTLPRFQDWDLWLALLERDVTGTYVPRTLFTAHYRPGDISTQSATEACDRQRVLQKHAPQA